MTPLPDPLPHPADVASQRYRDARMGEEYLTEALHCFMLAESPRVVRRLRACLKSAQGAVRHAKRRALDEIVNS